MGTAAARFNWNFKSVFAMRSCMGKCGLKYSRAVFLEIKKKKEKEEKRREKRKMKGGEEETRGNNF